MRRSLIRAETGDVLRMEPKKPRAVGSAATARAITHGEVYNWLFAHRREILGVVAKNGSVPTWAPYLERMEKEGVKRPSGKRLDAKNTSTRWFLVVAGLTKDARKKAAGPPKPAPPVVNWRTPNVEPPGRMPPPDTGIRFPTALTREPPGFRERYPETYGTPASPAAPPSPSTQGAPIHPEMTAEAAEQLAAVDRELRAIDGFQPKPRNRGRII